LGRLGAKVGAEGPGCSLSRDDPKWGCDVIELPHGDITEKEMMEQGEEFAEMIESMPQPETPSDAEVERWGRDVIELPNGDITTKDTLQQGEDFAEIIKKMP